MTEQTPLGGLAVADPRSPAQPLDLGSDAESPDNRRKLALVGAVLAVVVVLIAAFFLLKGGGSSSNAASFTPTKPAGSTGQAAPAAAKPIKLPKPYHGQVGRDPFKALYVAPAAPSGGTNPTGGDVTSGVAGAPVPVVVTGGGTTTPSSTGTTGTGTTTLGPNYAPVWVELVRVHGTKSANLVVGYTNGKRSATVTFADVQAPTQSMRTVFGRVFSLLSIQNGTVTVQLGDGTPFDLAPGFHNRHYLG